MAIPGLQTNDFFQVDPAAALENSALFWKRHALSYCKPPVPSNARARFTTGLAVWGAFVVCYRNEVEERRVECDSFRCWKVMRPTRSWVTFAGFCGGCWRCWRCQHSGRCSAKDFPRHTTVRCI
jgi:hypothetical protein